MAAPDLPLPSRIFDDVRDRAVAYLLFATLRSKRPPKAQISILMLRPIGLINHLMEGKRELTFLSPDKSKEENELCPRQNRHHECHTSREEAVQYLVQMKLADSVRPKGPEETIALIERYVFPTLDVCDKLVEEKKIVAGGPLGGAIALAVVVRAESIQELDDLLESLPVWPLMQTTVIPLTSFADRRDAGRRRLEGEVRRAGG